MSLFALLPHFFQFQYSCKVTPLFAAQVSENTRLRVTVQYPSSTALENFFQKFPEYATQDLQHTSRKLTRYTIQMGHVEPLMGTKPDLDESFDMAPDTAECVLLREISCTESLHQSHLKSFWLLGPDSTQSSEANYREGLAKNDEQPRSQRRPLSCAAGNGSCGLCVIYPNSVFVLRCVEG